MRNRNLLVFAALFSVAPLSARPTAPELQQHDSACPYEQAAAKAGEVTVTIETAAPEGSLLGAGRGAVFMP